MDVAVESSLSLEFHQQQGESHSLLLLKPKPDVFCRVLRLVLNSLPSVVAAKLVAVATACKHVASSESFWRSRCLAELRGELIDQSPACTWMRFYASWQGTLRLVDSHLWYQILGLHEDPKFLRMLRMESQLGVEQGVLENRAASLRSNLKQALYLKEFALKAVAQAAQVRKLAGQLELRESGLDANGVVARLAHIQERFVSFLSCPGCAKTYHEQEFNGPLFLEPCGHAVCVDCSRKLECPKCRALSLIPPSQDAGVGDYVKRLITVATNGDSFLLKHISDSLNTELLPSLKTRVGQTEHYSKLLHDKLEGNSVKLGKRVSTAFRRASLVHHPDRLGDGADFRLLCNASEVLGDHAKRHAYNLCPHESLCNTLPTETRCTALTRRNFAMLTDARPSMPSMPRLSLERIWRPPLIAWRIVCSWPPSRGSWIDVYKVEWRGPSIEDWTEMARVSPKKELGVDLTASTDVIFHSGDYDVRVRGGNQICFGPPSVAATISVPGVATREEIKEQERRQREAQRELEATELARRARAASRCAQKLQRKELSCLQASLSLISDVGLHSGNISTLALIHLRQALERVQVWSADIPHDEVLAKAMFDSVRILEDGSDMLESFYALPKQGQGSMLRQGRKQLRHQRARLALKGWWQSGALGSADRAKLTSIPELELTALIAERYDSDEVDLVASAYRQWRAEVHSTPDELGLVYEPGGDELTGSFFVAPAYVGDRGCALWDFLESQSLLWPRFSYCVDSSNGSATESEPDGAASESSLKDNGHIESKFPCLRFQIQLLFFEALGKRISEAGEVACPRIRKLVANEPLAESDEEEVGKLRERVTEQNDEDDGAALTQVVGGKSVVQKTADSDQCSKSLLPRSKPQGQGEAKRSRPAPPRTAYQFFAAKNSTFESLGADAVKMLWRELGADERVAFQNEATMDRERYQHEMALCEAARQKRSAPKKGRQQGWAHQGGCDRLVKSA